MHTSTTPSPARDAEALECIASFRTTSRGGRLARTLLFVFRSIFLLIKCSKGALQREIDHLHAHQSRSVSHPELETAAFSTMPPAPLSMMSQSSPSSQNSSSINPMTSRVEHSFPTVNTSLMGRPDTSPSCSPSLEGVTIEPRKLQDCLTL